MSDVILDSPLGFLQAVGTGDPDALRFEAAMPAFDLAVRSCCSILLFDLAVRLRVIRTRSHMGCSHETNEFFETPSNELRAIVRDDPRRFVGIGFEGFLQDDLHILLGHRLSSVVIEKFVALETLHSTSADKCFCWLESPYDMKRIFNSGH